MSFIMPREDLDWKIHNKMNPRSLEPYGIPGDGSIVGFLPDSKGFKEHPDWFALARDGSREPSHPCTTSEDMIKYVAEIVKAKARKGQGDRGDR